MRPKYLLTVFTGGIFISVHETRVLRPRSLANLGEYLWVRGYYRNGMSCTVSLDQVREAAGVSRDMVVLGGVIVHCGNRKAVDADCTVKKSHSQISTPCGFSWLEKTKPANIIHHQRERSPEALEDGPPVRSLIRIRLPSTEEDGVHRDEKVTTVKCLPNLPSMQSPSQPL